MVKITIINSIRWYMKISVIQEQVNKRYKPCVSTIVKGKKSQMTCPKTTMVDDLCKIDLDEDIKNVE